MGKLFKDTITITVDLRLIKIEDRLRQAHEGIDGLRSSLEELGPIQPPVVHQESDGSYKLLAGGRRLCAYKEIAEKTGNYDVDVLLLKELSRSTQLQIEIAENEAREDFTWAEKSAARVKLHEALVAEFGPAMRGSGHGILDTAKILGVDASTISKDIDTVEKFRKLGADPKKISKVFKTKSDFESAVASAVQQANKIEKIEQAAEIAIQEGSVVENMLTGFRVFPKSTEEDDSFDYGFFKGIQTWDGPKFDFVEFDPPYGIKYNKHKRSRKSLKAKGLSYNYTEIEQADYLDWLVHSLETINTVMSDNSLILVWNSWKNFSYICNILGALGLHVRAVPGFWIKPNGGCESPAFSLASCVEPFVLASKGTVELQQQARSNVFNFPSVSSSKRRHLAQRPIELMTEIFKTFVPPNSHFLVPCLGSGVTLEAGILLGHRGVGFEINQEHLDMWTVHVKTTYK